MFESFFITWDLCSVAAFVFILKRLGFRLYHYDYFLVFCFALGGPLFWVTYFVTVCHRKHRDKHWS